MKSKYSVGTIFYNCVSHLYITADKRMNVYQDKKKTVLMCFTQRTLF